MKLSYNINVEYYIYTDGASRPNPGKGSWAYIILENGIIVEEVVGCNYHTTNNRMEAEAIIYALESIKESSNIVVYSDSEYAIGLHTYKTNKNKDLRLKLKKLVKYHNVTFKHVKGHSGNYYNELVDNMACEELERYIKELQSTRAMQSSNGLSAV